MSSVSAVEQGIPEIKSSKYITLAYVGIKYSTLDLANIISSELKTSFDHDTWCSYTGNNHIITIEINVGGPIINNRHLPKLIKHISDLDLLDLGLTLVEVTPTFYFLTSVTSNFERLNWQDFVRECGEDCGPISEWDQTQIFKWLVECNFIKMPVLTFIQKYDCLKQFSTLLFGVSTKNLQDFEFLEELIKSNPKRTQSELYL